MAQKKVVAVWIGGAMYSPEKFEEKLNEKLASLQADISINIIDIKFIEIKFFPVALIIYEI